MAAGGWEWVRGPTPPKEPCWLLSVSAAHLPGIVMDDPAQVDPVRSCPNHIAHPRSFDAI